ncbi:MAG TPA: pilus assembly protein TadG-related protein [Trebonia sp.]|jgi:Flp pilus assembly protein TadG|nr:pilus assembly protein TadG-related protein [Trebonia sp.]
MRPITKIRSAAATRIPAVRQDRGSIAVFTAVFAFAVLLLLVLVVDGGTVLNGRERAADIAEQAARSAVTDLSIGDLHGETNGDTATSGATTVAINWPGACTYAQSTARDYAASLGSSISLDSATCPVQAPNSATVTVTVTVQPVIPFPGFSAVTVTATQTAAAVCGNADQQEVC